MTKIAAVSMESRVLDSSYNIDRTEWWIDKLSKRDINYILFPELSITGYLNNNEIDLYWKKERQIVINRLLKISAKNSCIAFSVGYPDQGYISQVTFLNGDIISKHNKTILGPSEINNFKAGEDLKASIVDTLKIGTQICFESHFPELSSYYEQQDCNLLAFPFASPREKLKEKQQRLQMMIRARAYDNSTFAIGCNATGKYGDNKRYSGVAFIVDPKGNIIAETASYNETYVEADIDLEHRDNIKSSKMGYFRKYKIKL